MLLPVVMLLLVLLLQPACLLYTRMVMCVTAAECARVLATLPQGSEERCRSYALRRLAAVPEVSPFHVGGEPDWQVELSSSEGEASVSICGHARPLPLLGALSTAFAERDDQGVVLRVSVSERMRPAWLGGDYGSWVGIWS